MKTQTSLTAMIAAIGALAGSAVPGAAQIANPFKRPKVPAVPKTAPVKPAAAPAAPDAATTADTTDSAQSVADGSPAAPPAYGKAGQVGTWYTFGTGDNRIKARVDSLELVKEYYFLFNGEKKRQRVDHPERDAYLVAHLTVQNLSAKPRVVFENDAGAAQPKARLLLSAKRAAGPYSRKKFDYLAFTGGDHFRRQSDGLTLVSDGYKKDYNMMQPGQTMRVWIARGVAPATDLPVTDLEMNFFVGQNGNERGVGEDIDPDAKDSLVTLDIRGKVTEAGAKPGAEGNKAGDGASSPSATGAGSENGSVPSGNEATAGRPAVPGKAYTIGTGGNKISLTVNRIEAADKYSYRDAQVMKVLQTERSEESELGGEHTKTQFLIVHVTVSNPTAKPQLVFRGGGERPWLQAALWRVEDPVVSNRYLSYELKKVCRESDNMELQYLSPSDMSAKNAAVLQPGQSVKAFYVLSFLDKVGGDPLVCLRVNYTKADYAATKLTAEARRGLDADPSEIAPSLLTYPLKGKIENFKPLYDESAAP